MKGKNSALAVCRLIKARFFHDSWHETCTGYRGSAQTISKKNYNHIEMNAVCAFLTKSFAGAGITSPGNV